MFRSKSERPVSTKTTALLWPLLFGAYVCSAQQLSAGGELGMQRPPYFISEPPALFEYTADKGAEIHCIADGIPKPEIVWKRLDDTEVESSDSGVLLLHPISAAMYNQSVYSGYYRCVAHNSLAVIASRLVKVLAIFDTEDTFVDVQDGVAIRGNTAILKCVYRGENAEFTWIRDDGLLISPQQQHNDRYQVLATGELLIHKTNMADKDRTYRCRVQDTVTNRILVSAKPATAHIVDLQNEVPPRAELVPKELSRPFNSRPISVPCVFSGNPTPNVTFFVRDGRKKIPLANNPSYTIEYNVVTFRPGHEVVIECRARNSVSEVKAEIVITAPRERIVVSLDPPHQVIDILTTATFKCRTNASYSSIVWMHNGYPIDSSSRFSIHKTKEGSSLTIHRVTMANSGIYQCMVSTTSLVQVAQASAELNVLGTQPIFFETFKSTVLEEGHSLVLSCKAKGIPAPSIEWFVDGVRYSNVPDLTIPRVDVSNAGFYTCVATNELGSNSHTARVDIYGKIQRKVAAKSLTVTQGSRIEVFCSYAGYPIDSVTWMKDNIKLNSSARHMIRENGILVIDQLQAGTDAGEYVCAIEGPSGKITSKTLVEFKVPPQIDTHFFPRKIEVEEGSRARLLCSVSKGDTPIRISWMRHGKILDTVPEGSVQYSDDSAMIKFKKVRFDDRGEYSCFASNQVSSVNQTTTVNVLVPPRWALNFPQTNFTYAIQGRPFRIDCPAEGYPTPVVSWSKSVDGSLFNEILLSRRISVHANGSLIFSSVFADADAAFYRCEARNGVGSPKKMTIELKIERGPQFSEIYQSISVEKGAHLTALSHVTAANSKTKFFYERNFQTFVCEPQRCKLVTNATSAVNLTIKETKREDSALYIFRAQNSFGEDHTFVNVVVQEPPETPRELAVYEVFGRNTTLRWNQPLFDGNSPVLSYIIQYKPHIENMGHSFSSVEVNGTSLRAVLSPLEPIQQYECRIAARNALGQSSFSDSIIFTTKEEPPSGSPTAIAIHATGSQSLKVTWRAPPKSDQNGVILGYYIGYRLADSSDDTYHFKTTHASLNNTFESTYLTNLRRQTRYLIVVKAFNRAGVGPPSEDLIAQTLETAPPTSPSIEVESASATSVIVRWNTNQLAPNTEYTLNYASDKNDWRKVKLSVDQSTHVVSGLACGTSYRFYVIASNSLGMGEPGAEVQVRTTGGPPVSAHKHFIVTNSTSATLLLDAWRSTGCPINTFSIQYRKRGTRNWYIPGDTISGSNERYTITQLSPGQGYEVKVTATSDAGPTTQDYHFTTLHSGMTSLESSLQDYAASSSMMHNRFTTIIVQVSLTIAISGGIFLLFCLVWFWYKKKGQTTNMASTPQMAHNKRKPDFAEDLYLFQEIPHLSSSKRCTLPYQDTESPIMQCVHKQDDPKLSSMGVMSQCGTLHNEEHIYATATMPGFHGLSQQLTCSTRC